MSPGNATMLVDNTKYIFFYPEFVWEQRLKFLVERNALVIDQQNVYHDVIACKPADVVAFIRVDHYLETLWKGWGSF